MADLPPRGAPTLPQTLPVGPDSERPITADTAAWRSGHHCRDRRSHTASPADPAARLPRGQRCALRQRQRQPCRVRVRATRRRRGRLRRWGCSATRGCHIRVRGRGASGVAARQSRRRNPTRTVQLSGARRIHTASVGRATLYAVRAPLL